MKFSTPILILKYIILAILIASVLYFSWLPEPSFKSLTFMPEWLIKWTDNYGRMRTAVPFIPLAYIAYSLSGNKRNYLLTTLILIILGLIAELVQLFLPHRFFDLYDIFWAIVGITIAWFLFLLTKYLNIFQSIKVSIL